MSVPRPPLELAVDVAVAAGALLAGFADRRRDGADLGVETKTSATDPVSEADRAAERLIAERLLAARPDDGLLGEEGQAPRTGTSGYRWVVDPLDGTVNFLYDRPSWCVSIACEDEHGSVVGVVHAPVLGETWVAERGAGARRLEGERVLAVSTVTTLEETLLATGFAYDPDVRAAQGVEAAELLGRVRDVRRGGSAALDLAWVAAGRVDGYYEHGLHPWDLAAGHLLVTEAGGRVTLVEREIAGHRLGGVVAGGPAVHDLLLAWETSR
jgi:myo-inositol-1(or 4)-monophosphatase